MSCSPAPIISASTSSSRGLNLGRLGGPRRCPQGEGRGGEGRGGEGRGGEGERGRGQGEVRGWRGSASKMDVLGPTGVSLHGTSEPLKDHTQRHTDTNTEWLEERKGKEVTIRQEGAKKNSESEKVEIKGKIR